MTPAGAPTEKDHPGTIPGTAGRRKSAALRYLARFDDGEVVRWTFRGLVIGTIGVLALDLRDMAQERQEMTPDAAAEVAEPILPPAVEGDMPTASNDPRPHLTADEEALRRPMTFILQADGVLAAEGFIDPGAAARFDEEVAERGEYVKTVRLNSPGGSLNDAIEIARLIRERNITTEVADGALCASSCPLVLAGGKARGAGEQAAVGIHQFYSAGDQPIEPAQAVSDAQVTTARIVRHLQQMGVDPALWLHALDTPPRALYYLTADELRRYRLTTEAGPVAQKVKKRRSQRLDGQATP